jgi:CDP-diacylglycerol--glycerol-3-phosphate 3-phosphatidyltransferase
MVFAEPFSVVFWICYLFGGLSDLMDGVVAKKLHQQSAAGAKFDSVADLIFAASILIVVIKSISIPAWVWLCIIFIGSLRIIGYGIGYYKFHTFSAVHTYMNKAVGFLIFAFPLLYALIGFNIAVIVVCSASFMSSVEELAITVKSKELDRDCRSIFIR